MPISRQELIDGISYNIYIYIYRIYIGYTKMHGENYPVEQEVDNIMTNVDLDHNGFIDYSGNIYIYKLCRISTGNP